MSRNVEDLHPSFQPIVREVQRRSPARDIYPFMTQGRRAPEYQACLWAQGRTTPGQIHDIAGLRVVTALSADKKSVIATCGKLSNVVPVRKWGGKVTNAGPYDSWHTLGLATDWSFRSNASAKDDLVGQLEEAQRVARAGGDTKRASRLVAEVEEKYTAFAAIWNEVVPDAIWGADWNDDGDKNGPGEFTDLPHFEWHPGVRSIRTLTADQRERILAGELPRPSSQCGVCRKFTAVSIDDACRECHEKLSHAPGAAPFLKVNS